MDAAGVLDDDQTEVGAVRLEGNDPPCLAASGGVDGEHPETEGFGVALGAVFRLRLVHSPNCTRFLPDFQRPQHVTDCISGRSGYCSFMLTTTGKRKLVSVQTSIPPELLEVVDAYAEQENRHRSNAAWQLIQLAADALQLAGGADVLELIREGVEARALKGKKTMRGRGAGAVTVNPAQPAVDI